MGRTWIGRPRWSRCERPCAIRSKRAGEELEPREANIAVGCEREREHGAVGHDGLREPRAAQLGNQLHRLASAVVDGQDIALVREERPEDKPNGRSGVQYPHAGGAARLEPGAVGDEQRLGAELQPVHARTRGSCTHRSLGSKGLQFEPRRLQQATRTDNERTHAALRT